MQFRDLQRQYEALKPAMDKALLESVVGARFIMGPQVRELEAQLAEFVGVKHCVSCANGTDALTLALKVWGIGAGDAVFVPDFTFFASAETVAASGATPVFVDVCRESFNIDPADLEKAIAEVEAEGKLRPRVIVAVDLFGLPADFPAIRKIADKHSLLILEDGAQGFGG
ncbi:MAG: aminotransferase class I/II-fold pyridoxal phosphate-dependent enzyme, partial [Bacteroidales bacterium]|nr:aminotransferase class I/II-fold pyridoxal phosphate-dependent enzyme [Bacteroidales bacterium]